MLEEIWVKLNLGHKTVGSKTLGPGKSLNGVLWMCSGCPNGVWKVSGSQGRKDEVKFRQVESGQVKLRQVK